jgi:hypothetical protein
MMPVETLIHLAPTYFAEHAGTERSKCERPLVSFGELSATSFRFGSGVCALRLQSDTGSLITLPFQGQQIWSAKFGGRNLTMKSMFQEPQPTTDFLATFGGFLQHCGATGAGAPSPQDTHPLHGELPNAPFQTAYLVTGRDQAGPYIGLGGAYRHTVAFAHNYLAEPLVKLRAGSTLFNVSMTITNLKRSDMELMYLAHVNFAPVDHGRLVYSAVCAPHHVRVRSAIPAHVHPEPDYAEFIARLQQEPALHETLTPDLDFDPEVVFFIDYLADEQGWAHSMQVHPDGSADYIRHRPDQLPRATRWICRTADQDAIAVVEPGTCEPEGYLAEKAKGNLQTLAPGEQFRCSLDIGVLSSVEARCLEDRIARLQKQDA